MTPVDPAVQPTTDDTLSGKFVAASLALAVIVTVGLIVVLPAWAGQVSEQVTPQGAITEGRISLQPQPGWDILTAADPTGEPIAEPSGTSDEVLVKDGVVLGLASVPATSGTDPKVYLEQLFAQFADPFLPEYEPVAFTTPTGDSGVAVLATGVDESGMFAAIVSRDGSVVALIPAIGDPVAVSAQIPDLSEMITGVRIKRAP